MRAISSIRAAVMAAAFATMLAPACAQERLEPERTIWSTGRSTEDAYDLDVAKAFKEVWEHGVVARVVVIPPFANEYAVGVINRNDRFEILHLKPEERLWLFQALDDLESGAVQIVGPQGDEKEQREIDELKERLPASPADVPMDRCLMEIEPVAAKPILAAWRRMLSLTAYPPRDDEMITVRADGVTYHFSESLGTPSMAGKTWSPDEDSPTGMLAQIADLLAEACTTGNPAPVETAQKTAVKLCRKIKCPRS
jgi:hypothetical protein